MNKEILELHAIVKGKVQGVGFRWLVCDIAEALGLIGTVRNLDSGEVEVIAQGSKEKLEKFVKNLKKSPGNSRVENIDYNYVSPTPLSGFKIIF